MRIFKTKERNINFNELIVDFVKKVLDFYSQIDNSLYIEGKRINLRNEEIKEVSLDYDESFYFNFFNAVSEYRERLKQNLAHSDINSLLQSSGDNFVIESRIKNINSIFSKIYQYINLKKEKGNVAINKCLNDLFGLRIVLPFAKQSDIKVHLESFIKDSGYKFKIIDASKLEYKAIHLYIFKDNYSLPWEIQFWLLKNDASNRESHAKYKQSYTSWELSYNSKDLYEAHKK